MATVMTSCLCSIRMRASTENSAEVVVDAAPRYVEGSLKLEKDSEVNLSKFAFPRESDYALCVTPFATRYHSFLLTCSDGTYTFAHAVTRAVKASKDVLGRAKLHAELLLGAAKDEEESLALKRIQQSSQVFEKEVIILLTKTPRHATIVLHLAATCARFKKHKWTEDEDMRLVWEKVVAALDVPTTGCLWEEDFDEKELSSHIPPATPRKRALLGRHTTWRDLPNAKMRCICCSRGKTEISAPSDKASCAAALPALDAGYNLLIRKFSPSDLLRVCSALLMEEKVIAMSGDASILFPCLEALRGIIFPFRWSYPYIPFCPASIPVADIIQAPFPFFFGVEREIMKNIQVPDDVLVVDIDSGETISSLTYPCIPPKYESKLRALYEHHSANAAEADGIKIANVHSVFFAQEHLDASDESSSSEDSAPKACTTKAIKRIVKFSHKQSAAGYIFPSAPADQEQLQRDAARVRIFFVKVYASMLKSFEIFMMRHSANEGAVGFLDKAAFLADLKSGPTKSFCERLVSTQAFSCFLEECKRSTECKDGDRELHLRLFFFKLKSRMQRRALKIRRLRSIDGYASEVFLRMMPSEDDDDDAGRRRQVLDYFLISKVWGAYLCELVGNQLRFYEPTPSMVAILKNRDTESATKSLKSVGRRGGKKRLSLTEEVNKEKLKWLKGSVVLVPGQVEIIVKDSQDKTQGVSRSKKWSFVYERKAPAQTPTPFCFDVNVSLGAVRMGNGTATSASDLDPLPVEVIRVYFCAPSANVRRAWLRLLTSRLQDHSTLLSLTDTFLSAEMKKQLEDARQVNLNGMRSRENASFFINVKHKSFEKHRKVNVRWMKNSEADACLACAKRFNVVRRRHHCRRCGKLFCSDCASKTAVVDFQDRADPCGEKRPKFFGLVRDDQDDNVAAKVKVCDFCYLVLK